MKALLIILALGCPVAAQESYLAPPCPSGVVAVPSSFGDALGADAAGLPPARSVGAARPVAAAPAASADKWRAFGPHFWGSTLVSFSGAGFDYGTTVYVIRYVPGQMEGNRVVRAPDGSLNRPVKAGLTLGLYGLTLIGERRAPKQMAIARYVMGVVWFAAGAWNLSRRDK